MTVASQVQLVPPASAADEGGAVMLPGQLPVGIELRDSAKLTSTVAACIEVCRAHPRCTACRWCQVQVGLGSRVCGVLGASAHAAAWS